MVKMSSIICKQKAALQLPNPEEFSAVVQVFSMVLPITAIGCVTPGLHIPGFKYMLATE
jgi:hypothetical protein